MQVDGHVPPPLHGCNRADVIHVCVCHPDRDDITAHPLDFGHEPVAIAARIDNSRCAATRIGYDVGVLLKWPEYERNDNHDEYPPVPMIIGSAAPLRSDVRYFSTVIAAVVASPAAVVTWRVSCARRSPAAKRPGIEVCMLASVRMYPMSS